MLSWVWLLSVVVVLCKAQEDRPVVDLTQGRVLGISVTQFNVSLLEFLSIPYARPPVGPLRFKDPEPNEPWEGDLDGSILPPSCDQLVQGGDEDCLYINIFTPMDALNTSEPLPVMVFLHGGAYVAGGAQNYHNYEVLVDNGVIVALPQYRLGIFGFMSTEDAAAPGNQGLKDQTLALAWVKNNIAAFGGDPQKVTIFGESAGSYSVHYQILAPSAAGLFSAAIMESGTALGVWARGRDFLINAQTLAERFLCPTEPSDALVECLQGVDQHLLEAEYSTFAIWNLQPFYFGPRIDGEYLPDEPVTLMQEGRYHHVPTIIGVNRDEGAMYSVEMYTIPSTIDKLVSNFTLYGPVSLSLYPDEEPLQTATQVYDHYYIGDLDITKEDADNLTQMYGDYLMLLPLDWTLALMSGQGPVFAYELHHRAEFSYVNAYLSTGLDLPQAYNYVCHADELQYLFNPLYSNMTRPDDITVGKIFSTMWTNFAKTQNPTPDTSLGFEWQLSDPSSLQHLKILPQEPYMEDDQRAEIRAFWESLPLRINNLLNP